MKPQPRAAPCDVQAVQNNGSVYLHAFFAPTGLPLDPKDPDHDAQTVFQRTESARPRARRPSSGLVLIAELYLLSHAGTGIADARKHLCIGELPPVKCSRVGIALPGPVLFRTWVIAGRLHTAPALQALLEFLQADACLHMPRH